MHSSASMVFTWSEPGIGASAAAAVQPGERAEVQDGAITGRTSSKMARRPSSSVKTSGRRSGEAGGASSSLFFPRGAEVPAKHATRWPSESSASERTAGRSRHSYTPPRISSMAVAVTVAAARAVRARLRGQLSFLLLARLSAEACRARRAGTTAQMSDRTKATSISSVNAGSQVVPVARPASEQVPEVPAIDP